MDKLHMRILGAKEEVSTIQKQMINKNNLPLVSISLNLPGKEKEAYFSKNMIRAAIDQVEAEMEKIGLVVFETRVIKLEIGYGAFISVEGQTTAIKRACIEIETKHKYSRLFDLDVISSEGQHVSRVAIGEKARSCWLCEKNSSECIRSKAHDKEKLLEVYKEMVCDFLAHESNAFDYEIYRIGALATEAMLLEVSSSPTPGLVDRYNSGAHSDMDINTFIKSSSTLSYYFYRMAQAGYTYEASDVSLLSIIRRIGLEAEKEMFRSTDGVNTQKGMLFLIGVASAAAGKILGENKALTEESVLTECTLICQGIVENELEQLHEKSKEGLTSGEKLYLAYGVKGIRGEISDGFPSIRTAGLPAIEKAFSTLLNLDHILLQTLLELMTITEDTTIINRHDLITLSYVKESACDFLEAGGMYAKDGLKKLEIMNEDFVSKSISPGGSADLLALTYFVYRLQYIN